MPFMEDALPQSAEMMRKQRKHELVNTHVSLRKAIRVLAYAYH